MMTDTTVTYTGGEVTDIEEPAIVQEPADPVDSIRLRVTPERSSELDLMTYLGSLDGNRVDTLNMLIHYMVNGHGEYVTRSEAMAILRGLKVKHYNGLVVKLVNSIGENSVPKETG
jgi:hypothetical protein